MVFDFVVFDFVVFDFVVFDFVVFDFVVFDFVVYFLNKRPIKVSMSLRFEYLIVKAKTLKLLEPKNK